MRKFIITAELRDITDRWINEHKEDSISYSKMVELLNEKALKYAEEYADSKWVSVETPPDEDKYVLCYFKNGNIKTCQYRKVFKMEYVSNAICETVNITHWQPLPSPPKQ